MVRYLTSTGDTNDKILYINREILSKILNITGDTNGKIFSINREILMVKIPNINGYILMVRYLASTRI